MQGQELRWLLGEFKLSGTVTYTKTFHPMIGYTVFTFDPANPVEQATLSKDPSYVDAVVNIQYVIYERHISSGAETELDIDTGPGSVIAGPNGEIRGNMGQGSFNIFPTHACRYKVRGGFFFMGSFQITGGAWTGNL